MDFSRELREDVLAGDITLSVRLWQRARVRTGGRYRVGPGEIEVDAIELVPFASVGGEDVRRSGERDRETLRERAAHAGPIGEDTLVYRIEFHAVSPGRPSRATAASDRFVARDPKDTADRGLLYSTVTDLARFRGRSTSVPRCRAV